MFIGSECLFFGTLISTYMVYRGRSLQGPYPHDILNVPLITVSTFVLLMSSLTMVLGVAAIQARDVRAARRWLLATAALGGVFLAGQVYEFSHFVHEGLGLTTNLFAATFYVMVGFHGAHVTVGVIWLADAVVPPGARPPGRPRTRRSWTWPGSTGTSSTWCGSRSSPSST